MLSFGLSNATATALHIVFILLFKPSDAEMVLLRVPSVVRRYLGLHDLLQI